MEMTGRLVLKIKNYDGMVQCSKFRLLFSCARHPHKPICLIIKSPKNTQKQGQQYNSSAYFLTLVATNGSQRILSKTKTNALSRPM